VPEDTHRDLTPAVRAIDHLTDHSRHAVVGIPTTEDQKGIHMTITEADDPGVQDDRFTSDARPPVITDAGGNGWSAVPHGTLIPQERDVEEPHFLGNDQVRLQRRSHSMTQNVRLTAQGARALAVQLAAAADAAEGIRTAEDEAVTAKLTAMQNRVREVASVRRGTQIMEGDREWTPGDGDDPAVAELADLRDRAMVTSFVGDQPVRWLLGELDDRIERACARVNEERAPTPANCPTCASPQPQLHPAVQFEGEVQVCSDPWHQAELPEPRWSDPRDDDDQPVLGKLAVLAEQFLIRQEGGQIVLSHNPEGGVGDKWHASLAFGREAPDSDMAAGVAYGMGTEASDALRTALSEAGESL
jgi:hypothetical protein